MLSDRSKTTSTGASILVRCSNSTVTRPSSRTTRCQSQASGRKRLPRYAPDAPGGDPALPSNDLRRPMTFHASCGNVSSRRLIRPRRPTSSQPAGAGGHEGSGVHPSGGSHPRGAGGHPGGGLHRRLGRAVAAIASSAMPLQASTALVLTMDTAIIPAESVPGLSASAWSTTDCRLRARAPATTRHNAAPRSPIIRRRW